MSCLKLPANIASKPLHIHSQKYLNNCAISANAAPNHHSRRLLTCALIASQMVSRCYCLEDVLSLISSRSLLYKTLRPGIYVDVLKPPKNIQAGNSSCQ